MSDELNYLEAATFSALRMMEEKRTEGIIPKDEAYIMMVMSVLDHVDPRSTNPTAGAGGVVVGMPPYREGKPLTLRERTTLVTGVMHSLIAFMQTGFEEVRTNPETCDFWISKDAQNANAREAALASCMAIVHGLAEQYEEDKNQIYN